MYLMHFVQWTCQYYIELMVGRVRSLCSRDCIIRIFLWSKIIHLLRKNFKFLEGRGRGNGVTAPTGIFLLDKR